MRMFFLTLFTAFLVFFGGGFNVWAVGYYTGTDNTTILVYAGDDFKPAFASYGRMDNVSPIYGSRTEPSSMGTLKRQITSEVNDNVITITSVVSGSYLGFFDKTVVHALDLDTGVLTVKYEYVWEKNEDEAFAITKDDAPYVFDKAINDMKELLRSQEDTMTEDPRKSGLKDVLSRLNSID